MQLTVNYENQISLRQLCFQWSALQQPKPYFVGIMTLTIKSERLSTNIKLTLYKALIKSIMVYVCSIWEYAADLTA
jgi:hypothetical protein